MTLLEFEKIVAEDENLRARLEERKAVVLSGVENKDSFGEIMSALAKEFGYDVPKEEFSLDIISDKELDEEELEKVSGGSSDPCWTNNRCFGIVRHPKSKDENAPCWSDYLCVKFEVMEVND